jgi:hypothetical protein
MTKEEEFADGTTTDFDETDLRTDRTQGSTSKPTKQSKAQIKEGAALLLRQQTPRLANWIAPRSMLFERGQPKDAADQSSFIRRMNALLAGGTWTPGARYPKDLAVAINKDGELNPHAELVVFGEWLLVRKAPGFERRGGRQFDPKLILRTTATALAELRRRKASAAAAGPGAETPKKPITATDLARRWTMLFPDPVKPSDFDARLRTLCRVLPAFLDHLRSGDCRQAGNTIRGAPEIKAVYKAISQRASSANSRQPGTMTSTSSATVAASLPIAPPKPTPTPLPTPLAPFDIELPYSAPAQEQECRNRPPGFLPPSTLTYQPVPATSSSTVRSVRKNRQGKIVLVPQLSIRENFKVRALIDRLVILVSVRKRSTGRGLGMMLNGDAKVTAFVQDTTIPTKAMDWRKQLKEPDWTKLTGFHFAIMIQDPTPEKLAMVLQLIDDRFNIDEPVELFLVELSVDFFPRPHHSEDEQIRLREQMVGLLQRHHWGSTALLQGRRPQQPRHADARQVYDKPGGKPKETDPRYLFPDQSSPQFADTEFEQPEVIARLLRAKSGTLPFLNATIYKGCDETGRKISIQHKVADQRNTARGTKNPLPDRERRARIEFLLIRQDILEDHKLRGVETLGTVSFRKLCRKLLHFRLPLVEPTQERLEEAIAHMEHRGVYGIELAARARAQREKAAARAAGEPVPRKRVGEGADLQDWQEMNTLAGEALDELGRAWRGFSWR